MDVDKAMRIHFQEEIIVEILIRLPVRSLLRFKCVSKYWRALISDPYFKMKHLNHAKNNQNSQKFLVSQFRINKDNAFSLYSSSLSWVQRVEDVQKLDCPSNFDPCSLKIFCCYDGLSLIGVRSFSDNHLIILLWNPSTRESIVLPHPELPNEGHCTWGLGYDSTSDDYKILKIDHKVCSEVLALRSGSWRKIDRHPNPVLSGMDSLAVVHGAFHWLGGVSPNYSVVSLSVSNEVYGELPLPEGMRSSCSVEHTEHGVSVLRGMLCCYSTTYICGNEGSFNLWVMEDYGVKESWNLLTTIIHHSLYSAIPIYWVAESATLVCCKFLKDDGSVFMTSRGPFGSWPLRDTVQEGFVYTESLISPKMTPKTNLFNQSNREVTQKTDLFNQSNREAPMVTTKTNLKRSAPSDLHGQDCRGKRVVKLSKQIDVAQAMGIYFREEIIVEILIRLPVRYLLQFKCVSKSWKSLISDPYFKMKHLSHAKNDQNSQKLLVSQFHINEDNVFSLYSSSLSCRRDVQKLDCPSKFEPWAQKIYCCYDGLSLIGVHNFPDKHLSISLWNPSTRESIEIPHPELPAKGPCTWGLGYDSTSDDYRILKIDHKVCSEVLALKSGSWRKVDRHPNPVLSGMGSLAFVHGAFHWLGGMSPNYYVVSFSISNEVYGEEIPLPKSICTVSNGEYIERGVSVLRGMLCCYSTSYIHGKEGTFKLWAMEEYGVEESWNLLTTIECTGVYSAIPIYSFADRDTLICARYLKAGGSIFMTSKGPFGFWRLWNMLQEGFVYTESLISPKLMTA